MVEAPINRIKQHLRETKPATRQERGENYINTLQLALDTLRELMTSFNPEMQYKGVMAMLDLEKTRLRHNHSLAGMDTSKPIDWDEPIVPLPKFDKPIIDPIVDEDNDGPTLSTEQEAQFEKMIDEAMESCGAADHPNRERAESELWDQVCEHGFNKVKTNFRRCMDKRKANRPYSGGTLEWVS